MGTITETTPATYPTTVYQIEDGDRADGGALGPSNQAVIALTNRTKWLKENLDTKAPLASPAFTNNPTAPTAPVGTNTDQVATTAFVRNLFSATGRCSLTENGWQILPSGLIVQWGSLSVANMSSGSQWSKAAWSATLPIAFPTAGLFGFAAPGVALDTGWDSIEHTLGVDAVTTTAINGKMMRLTGGPASWDTQQIMFIAIGH